VNVRATRFPLFDSMRAIAVLAVVATHGAFFSGLGGHGSAAGPFLGRLDVGVHIFFLISAFLLYRPFVRAGIEDAEPPLVRAYAWRRFLRIVPGYWLALTVIALALGLPGVFGADAPLYYGLAQIYTPETSGGGLPQAWSLCVELSFYLFLPLYAALMRRLPAGDERGRLRRELGGAAVLVLVSFAYKLWILSMGPATAFRLVPWHFALPAFLDTFALGMALATLSAWYAGRATPAPLRALDRFPSLAWLLAAVAFWVVSTRIGLVGRAGEPLSESQYLGRHWLYALVGLGVLLPAVFGDQARGLVRRLLALRPLLYVGLVSYGVYLYHFAVYAQLRRWGFGSLASDTSPWLWLPAGLAGSLLLASLSYYAVERPLLRLKRLVPGRERSEAGEAIAEPAPARPPRLTQAG